MKNSPMTKFREERNMKRLLVLLPAVLMTLCMLAGCSGTSAAPGTAGYQIAMITDFGDITDQSFNQTTCEAVVSFSEDHGIPAKYFKPASNDTASRVAQVELAVAEGCNVIVMPGYAFAGTLVEIAAEYPSVKFIALDVSKGALLSEAVPLSGKIYDYDPENWDLKDYVDLDNVYCAVYQEALCSYMAGYAAVKLGYTRLGFLGGMAVPAVMRYGYGCVQGADAAAKELNITVDMKYVYGNQFYGDADNTAYMDTWYQGGTDVVFAFGGGIYTSVVDAAKKVDGARVIGVDVDQADIIAAYAAGAGASADEIARWHDLTVTSAMKGLAPPTIDTLTDVLINGNWDAYAGRIDTLGLVSGEDPTRNYVQLPDTTQFQEGSFTETDYKALIKGMFDGSVTVSGDTAKAPAATHVRMEYLGSIK